MLRVNKTLIRLPCRYCMQNYATKSFHKELATDRRARYYTAHGPGDRFAYRQPPSRLGTGHLSLSSFLKATGIGKTNDTKEVELSTLIILTNITERKILLGKKLRGFGTGKYNGFGGRLERQEIDQSPAHGARRELMEEANLVIDLDGFTKVGNLSFTFQDRENIEMLVHLFHVNVDFNDVGSKHGNTFKGTIINPNTIQACDEMIPEWFDWREVPFDKMFADDSIWLTYFLSTLDDAPCDTRNDNVSSPKMNGWFHFAPGGDGNNQILHYFLET